MKIVDKEQAVDCRQAIDNIIRILAEAKRFKPGDGLYLLHEKQSPARELTQEQKVLLEERKKLLDWQAEIIRENYG